MIPGPEDERYGITVDVAGVVFEFSVLQFDVRHCSSNITVWESGTNEVSVCSRPVIEEGASQFLSSIRYLPVFVTMWIRPDELKPGETRPSRTTGGGKTKGSPADRTGRTEQGTERGKATVPPGGETETKRGEAKPETTPIAVVGSLARSESAPRDLAAHHPGDDPECHAGIHPVGVGGVVPTPAGTTGPSKSRHQPGARCGALSNSR
ncbi:hypothetical protein [Methanopyrus kandleri]